MFFIRAGIDKARFEFGLTKIFEEIERIANGDISQEEFDNAIGYNEGQIQMGIESSNEMSNFLGSQFLIYDKIESLEDILQKYKALQLADVQAIASKLMRDNCFLYYIK